MCRRFLWKLSGSCSQQITWENISAAIAGKKENIKSIFSELKKQAETTDKTFGNLVAAEEVRQLKSFERMHKRLLRAEKLCRQISISATTSYMK